jgi:hypothetical protein
MSDNAEMAKITIGVIPDKLWKLIARDAAKRGVPISKVLRELGLET